MTLEEIRELILNKFSEEEINNDPFLQIILNGNDNFPVDVIEEAFIYYKNNKEN